MVSKVDMTKAYGQLSWNADQLTLKKMGSQKKGVQWILACI